MLTHRSGTDSPPSLVIPTLRECAAHDCSCASLKGKKKGRTRRRRCDRKRRSGDAGREERKSHERNVRLTHLSRLLSPIFFLLRSNQQGAAPAFFCDVTQPLSAAAAAAGPPACRGRAGRRERREGRMQKNKIKNTPISSDEEDDTASDEAGSVT